MSRTLLPLVVLAIVLCSACTPSWAQAPIELKVDQAQLLVNGSVAKPSITADALGPGEGSVRFAQGGPIRSQLRWSCAGVPEGDYYIGVSTMSERVLDFTERVQQQLHLYHNDTRLSWTSHSEPCRPEKARPLYQAQMRHDKPLHIRPGDCIRLVTGDITIGSLRLYKAPFTDSCATFKTFLPERIEHDWLNMAWEPTQRQGDRVTQSCWLYNPGVLPRTFQLKVQAMDYLQVPQVDTQETITLKAGEKIARTFTLKLTDTGQFRLNLVATCDKVFPVQTLVKYFVDDIRGTPRPRASLNGSWEMCYVPKPSVEPGDAPPAGAAWKSVKVPVLIENKLGHCIWLRRKFDSPPFLRGERVVMKFGLLLSEGWIYINGKRVHHQADGAHPFEVDVTEGWRFGKENEILIAVRDWLAHSPRNRQRVQEGEEPVHNDSMIAPAGYIAKGTYSGSMGMGRPVWIEARPAVAVEETFITTTLRDRKLAVRYRVANKSSAQAKVTLAPVVLDAGREFARLPSKEVTIEPGATATVTISAPWPDKAKFWQPGEPYLYVLATDVQGAAGAADRHIRRFGFRDIWIDGIHFYVNGVRHKIRSAWANGAHAANWCYLEQELDKRLEVAWSWQTHCMLNQATELSRAHNLVGVDELCEVADESGLMLKIENGSFCQQGFTFDQAFWHASVASEKRMVEVYGSHPSVFMWSAGNENMWGWAYQGEGTRTVGNRWQVKIAKAMRDSDPQARPIEWEADGDLMGKWEYHQLHYPRELNGHHELPVSAWWGPLDGKTVVPYSMGDIILGQKPITEGEAFWGANLNRPFGVSLVLGDKPYIGGPFWAEGWMESSIMYTNGFRDIEMALIDTFTSLAVIKPQMVVFKEETSELVGGQTVVRNLNVHNDVRRPAKLTLRWSLTGPGNQCFDRGERTMDLKPAALERLAVKVNLPKTSSPTPATFLVELREDGKVVLGEHRSWVIAPSTSLAMPANLKISLYDPVGKTAALLRAMKAPFEAAELLKAPPAGQALVLGQDALKQPPQGPWREQVLAFVRGGGRVLVLEQSETPDFLPFPVALAAKSNSTMTFPRAMDHPLLNGLCEEGRLRWWADDHYLSRGNYRKPIGGNVLPIVDAGTMDGLLESPLMEQYLGRGSIVLCQLQVTQKAATAPQAARLLQNMLDYLAAPAPYRRMGQTALLAGKNETLRKMIDAGKVNYENLSGRTGELRVEQFSAVIVDASSIDGPASAALKEFARQGGNVLIYQATPANQSALESLLGIKLRLFAVAKEGNDVKNHVLRRMGGGLLGGVSNHDFYWASGEYIKEIQREGVWWSNVSQVPPEEQIAEYFCQPADADADKATRLTYPCVLFEVPYGKGRMVVSQLRLESPVESCAQTASRLRSLLLTNLGCTIEGQSGKGVSRAERLRKYDFSTIDIGPWCNRGLRDDPAKKIVGWTNQGENDMRAMSVGRQSFADVPFFIASPKAAAVLYSTNGLNTDLPKEIKGIKVGQRADAVFFLHSIAWTGGPKPFKYRVNYDDGTSVEVPIANGSHVFDWWSDPSRYAENMAANGVVVGFRGDNPLHKGAVVLLYEWVNPKPDKAITTIDYLRVDQDFVGIPVLAGITVARLTADQGVVEDVLGTEGVRVRLGTQLTDVRYIGVKGLEKDHPFYAQAVAAHKAMVVGKKVFVQDDVVGRNAAGQRLSYVFMTDARGFLIENMLNGRMVGDGLGRLGNFEGNNRHRMYLENLGFIASQGKKGLWASGK